MVGKVIAHYEILEKIGAGGMGEVYRAHDRKLGRDVALKTLPPEVACDPERIQRLMREARAVAGLNHPNLVTVYSVEECEGVHFLTMELVKGEPLQHAIGVDGLPNERFCELALPLSDALAAAHELGVIHRDLKPANIMVGGPSRVKILDFGLARIVEAGTGTADDQTGLMVQTLQTAEGVVMGTAPYMSPEQITGKQVDHRSDIFSFGIIMYEMATGQRPFRGDSAPELVSAILRDQPATVSELDPDLSPRLAMIIQRCLEKDPERRFQTARNLHDALIALSRELEAGSISDGASTLSGGHLTRSRSRRPLLVGLTALAVVLLMGIWLRGWLVTPSAALGSVAILPFVNNSTDPDTEYLSDGVTESLINRLSQLSNLKVMSRNSVFRFKEASRDPQEIGRQLGVSAVLTGHVAVRGEKLIVGTELLDVDDGSHLWGDRFERDMSDLSDIEQDIVTTITDRLSVKLTGEESARLAAQVKLDPEAHNLYLKGRYFLVGSTEEELARAREYFRQAIAKEPRHALAYAGLADTYVSQAWLLSADRDDVVAKAKAALSRALEIDDSLAEAHVAAGQVRMYFDWDWAGAETEFRRAIELSPGSDLAHRAFSSYLGIMNRLDEAIVASRKAQELDPLSTHATHNLAFHLMMAGRYQDAVGEFKKAIELNPTWIWGNIKLAMAYSLMGDDENALVAAARADELLGDTPGSPLAQSWLANIHLRAGNPRRLHDTLVRMQERAKSDYVDPMIMALYHHDLGDYQKSLTLLEKAYAVRSPLMVYLKLDAESFLRGVSDDPRYQDLLRRMKFNKGTSQS